MPRITGKLGTLTLTGHGAVADIYNWTLEYNIKAEPCGIKGDKAEQYSLGEFTGRITAERFSTDTDNDSVLADAAVETAATIGTAGTAAAGGGGSMVTYTLEQVSGGAAGATIGGTGFLVTGGLNAPRAMAIDRAEILLNAIPTIS